MAGGNLEEWARDLKNEMSEDLRNWMPSEFPTFAQQGDIIDSGIEILHTYIYSWAFLQEAGSDDPTIGHSSRRPARTRRCAHASDLDTCQAPADPKSP